MSKKKKFPDLSESIQQIQDKKNEDGLVDKIAKTTIQGGVAAVAGGVVVAVATPFALTTGAIIGAGGYGLYKLRKWYKKHQEKPY